MARHRCESIRRSAVRVKSGGQVNRNVRCDSTDTILHVRNMILESQRLMWARRDDNPTMRFGTEAWFCDKHAHRQTIGVTDWVIA
jgi:hypothetical protein